MADENIKKVRIPFDDLPPINVPSEGYNIRYRFISDDRNRSSHWSPVYIIEPQFIFVPQSIGFRKTSSIVTYDWDAIVVLKVIEEVVGVTNKQLTTKVATLTTSGAHYMSPGDWVVIEDVGSPFNGTHKITSVTTTSFSYFIDSGNVASTPVSPNGIYKKMSYIKTISEYDLWLRWDRNDGGDWLYKERIGSTSISFPVPAYYTINNVIQPSAPNHVSIEIYLPGFPLQRGDGVPLDLGSPILKVYQLLNETV